MKSNALMRDDKKIEKPKTKRQVLSVSGMSNGKLSNCYLMADYG